MRSLRGLLTAVALTGLLAGASATQAVVVTWNLVGVNFTDGGTASGMFNYDFSTNTYSAVDITTTNGSARTGAHYTFLNALGLAPSNTQALFSTIAPGNDLTGTPGLALFFSPGLPNGAGGVSVTGTEANNGNFNGTFPAEPVRSIVANGRVSGDLAAVVPLPPAFASGLALLCATGVAKLRRRKV